MREGEGVLWLGRAWAEGCGGCVWYVFVCQLLASLLTHCSLLIAYYLLMNLLDLKFLIEPSFADRHAETSLPGSRSTVDQNEW